MKPFVLKGTASELGPNGDRAINNIGKYTFLLSKNS